MREHWCDLSGEWEFAHDDGRDGSARGWHTGQVGLAERIVVPFPPESPASGIASRDFHPVVWYRRVLTAADLDSAAHDDSRTLLLHFGAVDYRATVWIDGRLAGTHIGGHTPFTVVVDSPGPGTVIVVCAEDAPDDPAQPRGKQDWEPTPHVIWYDRTTGIWQPVWLESVPPQHIERLGWAPCEPEAAVSLSVEIGGKAAMVRTVRVTIQHEQESLAVTETRTMSSSRVELPITIRAWRNGQDRERFRWSPEHPTLMDAWVELLDSDGEVVDCVSSYFGLRSVAVREGRFLLNGHPYQLRGVLEQGFWPGSHLAAPDAVALRTEVELIRQLGFNTARIHQKVEDPRFLYWADRLGLMIWAEQPAAYEFCSTSIERLTTEWLEVLRRDGGHPCIVTWVPFNESWGVGDIASSAEQRALTRALYHLTKAYDASRIVIANDGWEHTEADLFTVHDYENDAEALSARYATAGVAHGELSGMGINGRQMTVEPTCRDIVRAAPIVLTEFGGVSYNTSRVEGSWGYRTVGDAASFEAQLRALLGAVQASGVLAGWCYTQLTDTQQETNGLLDEDRKPKLPVEVLRKIIAGD